MDGRVEIEGETLFMSKGRRKLDFMLVAEGQRKLGLLWLLLQNGVLAKDSILFIDEPEANLNPKLYGVVIDVLLALQRMGVQVFIATHDYVILKEIDLRMKLDDKVTFHAFEKTSDTGVILHSTNDYLQISPNGIADTFSDLFRRELARPENGGQH
jgi:predicted ATPase